MTAIIRIPLRLLTFRAVLACLMAPLWISFLYSQAARPATELQAIKTGPEPGQKIPAFTALDQNGKKQTFDTIRGPEGALLVFFRSADW